MAEDLCLSCGRPSPNSLKILGVYLCPECERKLVQSTVVASDYQHWVASCRKVWESAAIEFKETKD
jgi:DNA-directed RNA polymerase subunit RPC12/RpoP